MPAVTRAIPLPAGFSPADPGLIGLLGFVLATSTAQLGHLGIQEESSTFWVGAVFGGVVQVIAGMLSYFKGDNFHFLVYNAFGFYWIVVPGFLLGEQLQLFEVAGGDRGLFALAFSILAFVFVAAGATHNTVLPLTLLCVGAGLGLDAIASFAHVDAYGIAGACLLLVASAMAAYMLVEKFYSLTLGRRLLPVGPPWWGYAGDTAS